MLSHNHRSRPSKCSRNWQRSEEVPTSSSFALRGGQSTCDFLRVKQTLFCFEIALKKRGMALQEKAEAKASHIVTVAGAGLAVVVVAAVADQAESRSVCAIVNFTYTFL